MEINNQTEQPAFQNNLKAIPTVKLSAKYALVAFGLYIAYFLLMRLAGLATIIELRFLNYVFFCLAGLAVLKKAEEINNGFLKYLKGVALVFLTGGFSFLYFAGFILLYSFIDPIMMVILEENYPGSIVFGRLGVPFLVISEGIAVSAILTLCLVPLYQSITKKKVVNYREVLSD